MPIYEYRCPNGHTFELFQRMSDPSPSECQICGAGPVHKVLYPAAIHFKGSGFYSTDYGKQAGASNTSDASSKSETKAESKDSSKSSSSSESSSASD
jgi:putative FmdB family regulatory protein